MSAAFLKQSGTNIRPTSCYKQPSWSNSRCNVRKCVLLKRISEELAFSIDGARRLFWSWSDEERKVHAVVWIFGACLVACPPSPPFFLDLLFSLFLHQSLKCRHLPRSGLLHSSCVSSEPVINPLTSEFPLPCYEMPLFIHPLPSSSSSSLFLFLPLPLFSLQSSQFSSLVPLELRLVCWYHVFIIPVKCW